MFDREKVVKELESLRDICNAKSNMAIGKGKFAWAGYANTADDAIALLKEQQETISSFQGTICKLNAALEEQPDIVRCGECKYYREGFCYNPNTYETTGGNTVPDWYCADGKRKEAQE